MTCNCSTVCRFPDIETQDGKYPRPNHAPMCNEYKAIKFARVGCDGTFFVAAHEDAKDFISDSTLEYVIEDVYLTQDQFDKIKEFEGF